MKTVKSKAVRKQPKQTAPVVENEVPQQPAASFEYIAISDIDISPLNYRKYFAPGSLEAFAENIAALELISPVTLRPMPTGGRYELVAGERRFRAAKIAGLQTLPAMVRPLTDQQVMEIQLAENIQRENPHPFHEAQAIERLQQTGKSIEEIAARLGKSKSFVYSRTKLSGLIEVMQDIFLADKITVQEAYEIASLSPASQHEFYESYCTEWEEEYFELPGSYAINRFRYDLTRAPFDIKDKELVPEKGACTNCPLNSATLKTLFPEMAKQAVCSGADCYQNKRNKHYQKQIEDAALQLPPQALIYDNSHFFVEVTGIIDNIENLKDLPRYTKRSVSEIKAPVPPSRDDYMEADEQTEYFNEEGYNHALDEYNSRLEDYHQRINSGQTQSGLLITQDGVRFMLFMPPEQQEAYNEQQTVQLTAKAVQGAIKDGTVTAEMIEGEINRILTREKRFVEIDEGKVQSNIHKGFMDQFSQPENNQALTQADHVAMRLIVFESLSYYSRNKVQEALHIEDHDLGQEQFYQTLSGLTEAQFAYMVRMAIAQSTNSNEPGNIRGWCLLAVAREAGFNVDAVRQAQQEIADERWQKAEARIKDLERRKEKLRQKSMLTQAV